MSAISTLQPTETQAERGPVQLGRIAPVAVLLALAGTVATGVLLLSPASQLPMFGSYLFGLIFWLGITLGFFGLSLLHHTIRPSWSVPLLRMLEAGGGLVAFLTMAVLFIPILVNLPTLYEWARPEVVAAEPVLKHKANYLNPGFFAVRFIGYFAIWGFWAWFMRKSTLKQDETKNFKLETGRSSWGAPGLLLFFITTTFAFTDWVMSLEPHWYSTIYGVWSSVSAGLGALGLVAALFLANSKKDPYSSVISPKLSTDIGNMLFVLTLLWAYTSISQFLIIWNGNLPETAVYFRVRSEFGWNFIGLTLIVGQFLLPFMWLLAPRAKKYPSLLLRIAAWIFVMHVIDVYMVVVPALPVPHGHPHRAVGENLLFDAIAFVTVGAFWFAAFASQLRKAPLLPAYDNRLQEAQKHAH